MFVKICGITNREDAFAAVDAGAGALGFIFSRKSPRFVETAAIASWVREIPEGIWKVGVFVNESPALIEEIGTRLGLDVAQLHGTETPEQHPQGLRIWKAFRVERDTVAQPDYPAEAILLDGPGSGRTFNWSVRASVSKPMILAGGLTPDNIEEAIEKTNPWGVDAASGVELSPGRKDHERMKRFIKAALRS